jgi:RNA polymerase sigma-70 factor (ECF subfamily)
VENNQSFVYSIAFRMLCNSFEAEEIVQETFIRVWKNLKRFNNEMQFTTWLYKIAVNLCYDKMKAGKPFKNNVSIDFKNNVVFTIASLENTESQIINKDLAAIIIFLTDELTPKQKLVFTLTELEGLSNEDIAKITGLTPQKIKSNLYCAKQTIRQKLEAIIERRGIYED